MGTNAYDSKKYIDPTVNRPEVSFTVPGEPVSKSRHRTGLRGGQVRHYADPKNAKAQEAVGIYYRQARGPGAAGAGGFGVTAEFHVKARQRRDIDNMLKLVFDGLTGCAWIDDSQVTEVHAKLIHGSESPRSEVRVYPTEDLPDWHSRQCDFCKKPFRTYHSWSGKVKWCSVECRSAMRNLQKERTCRNCGVSFKSHHIKQDAQFCSKDCNYSYKQVELQCDKCGKSYRKARSLAKAGKKFCGTECREAYWRDHRKVVARGTCAVCNEPTSKKSYLRCNACRVSGKWPTPDDKSRREAGF